ncbi:polyprenyl synthetase family protein [Chloroflexota bacterium]
MNTDDIFAPIKEELDAVRSTMLDATKEDNPRLTGPLEYALKNQGKLVRPAITLLCGKLFNNNAKPLIQMSASIEFLHLASLLHDDTIDKSDTRRGQPTVSNIWGNSTAILIGDYLFAKSAHMVSTLGKTEMMTIFAQTLMSLCIGVLEESNNIYNAKQTRDDYYKKIDNKTASLFYLASESGAALGEASKKNVDALKSYGYNLGMAFQIIDDILDFTGEQEEMGKPVGSDFLSGNLTLPAMLLMEKQPQDNLIETAFKAKCKGEDVQQIIAKIQNSPMIEQSYAVANDFCFKSKQALADIPDSSAKESLLDLADYVIERRK